MTDGNWISDAYAILNSDPSAVSSLADQWGQLGTTLATVKPETIDPALTRAVSTWNTGGPALDAYGQALGDKLTVLAETAQQVATGLHGYADQLAKARADLTQLLTTILIAVASSALVLALPEGLLAAGLLADSARFATILTNWVRPAGATTSVLAMITALRSYFAYADDVSGMLARANQDLAALNTMSTAGATLPDVSTMDTGPAPSGHGNR